MSLLSLLVYPIFCFSKHLGVQDILRCFLSLKTTLIFLIVEHICNFLDKIIHTGKTSTQIITFYYHTFFRHDLTVAHNFRESNYSRWYPCIAHPNHIAGLHRLPEAETVMHHARRAPTTACASQFGIEL